jgi:hypothetical protein
MKIGRKFARNGEENDRLRYALTPEIGVAISYAAAGVVLTAGVIFYYDELVGAFSAFGDPKVFFAVIFAAFLVVGALLMPKWLSKYTLDTDGVRLSFVGITRKFVAWERVKEVRYSVYGAKPLLFISENPLDGLKFSEINNSKSQITVICSAKMLEAVKAFYKDEIINYPKNSIIV